jgi:nucleotidyltransferase/DNA polymerase involved in DNA repair
MNSSAPNSELRCEQAIADGLLRVAWVDERGRLRCMAGQCIDASARRIHLEVRQQIPLRTRVTLSAGRKRVPGPNVVKYLTKCASKFILVLE